MRDELVLGRTLRWLTPAALFLALDATSAVAQSMWRASDLGTIGVQLNSASWAEDVNDAGYVVGASLYDDPLLRRHAFVWTPEGGMVDLGAPGGDISRNHSWAKAINNAGQVVGFYQVISAGWTLDWAFLWTAEGGMVELGGLGGWMARPNDINDLGQMVGAWYPSNPSSVAFLWTPVGGTVNLGTLGGYQSRANAINNLGAVVGTSQTEIGGPTVPSHAFLWTEADGMIDLGTLPGTPMAGWASEAYGINDTGQVVGWSLTDTGDLEDRHAFLWTASDGMVDLGTLGGSWSEAHDISNSGQIVGASETANGAIHGFVWTPENGMVDLGTMSNERTVSSVVRSGAAAINNVDQIAGSAGTSPAEHAAVWDRRVDLALDFGSAYGLYTLHHGDLWRPVHNLSPESMAVGNVDRGFQGSFADDLVLDFGPGVGTYAWLNHSASWRFIHPTSPSVMTNGDLDGDFWARDESILSFPGAGTYELLLSPYGVQLHTSEAGHLAIGELDGTLGEELVASFPGLGLWRLDCVPRPLQPGEPFPQLCEPGRGWAQLHPFEVAGLLTVDLDGNGLDDVVVEFVGWGLWAFMNQTAWVLIHPFGPAHVAAGNLDGNHLADLVIDFGPGLGIWTLLNGSTWVPLHGFASEGILLLDRDGNGMDEVVVDFGPGIGLYAYVNASSWTMLHGLSPETMVAGRFH